MNIEAVRAFVTVAEEGQFQLAADRLDVSQQAVSKRIAGLEAELGTALFKRTPSGAALTQDGRTFLPHAGAILAAVSKALASVQPGTRPLRVDVLERGTGAVDLLRDFCQDNPAVPVEMVIGGGAASTFRSLLVGEIDAGYAYLRDVANELDPALARTYAFLEPAHVIVSVRHPLARSREVRASELARYRAWVPGIVAGSEWETYFQDFAEAFGLDIDPTGYAVGSESVFDAIARSRSLVTFVGERNRVGWPGGLGLARLPVVDPVPLYPWSLIWRADTVHAGAKHLVSHVKRTYEPPSDGTAVWLPRQARDDLQLSRTTAGSAAPARRVRGGAVMMGAVVGDRTGITKEAAAWTLP
jgi:DNA-binding transcriptional LysR family regulator